MTTKDDKLTPNNMPPLTKDEIPDLDALKGELDPTLTLSENQKRFLENWVKTGGNIAKSLKLTGLGSSSFRLYKPLLQKPAARLYIQSIKQTGFAQAVLSVNEVVEKFRKVYDKAIKDGDFKAANEATLHLGKYLGMFVDRSESTQKTITHITGDKPEEVKNDIKYFEDIVKKAARNLKDRNLKIALANKEE
jgi:hypothetical protein